MKPIYIIILLAFAGCFYSCKTKKVIENPVVEEVKPQADTTLIPSFPSEVLYVLTREYESVWDSTREKYETKEAEYIRNNNVSIKKFMEQRLMTLFPDLAYVGLLDKIENNAKEMLPSVSKVTPSLKVSMKVIGLWLKRKHSPLRTNTRGASRFAVMNADRKGLNKLKGELKTLP